MSLEVSGICENGSIAIWATYRFGGSACSKRRADHIDRINNAWWYCHRVFGSKAKGQTRLRKRLQHSRRDRNRRYSRVWLVDSVTSSLVSNARRTRLREIRGPASCSALRGQASLMLYDRRKTNPPDVLTMSGSAGGADRYVTVPVDTSITVDLTEAPAGSGAGRSILYSWLGAPSTPTPIDAGGVRLGCMVSAVPIGMTSETSPLRCLRRAGIPRAVCNGGSGDH